MELAGYDEEMETHLCRIAQEVFLLMVDMELQPCAAVPETMATVAAKLCYRAPAGMELELMFEPALACAATQRLMSLECLPAVADDMVRDSVGEIVNMVGGNFHSILSPGMALDTTPMSTPVVADGRRVRVEACLGAAQGAVRLRLTDMVQ